MGGYLFCGRAHIGRGRKIFDQKETPRRCFASPGRVKFGTWTGVWSGTAQTDADRGKRPVKAPAFPMRRIDAAIYGAKEHVGAITDADFRNRISPGHPREPAEIGNGNVLFAFRRRRGMLVGRLGYIIMFEVNFGGLMALTRSLTPKQDRTVQTPIECDASYRRIARQVRGGIP